MGAVEPRGEDRAGHPLLTAKVLVVAIGRRFGLRDLVGGPCIVSGLCVNLVSMRRMLVLGIHVRHQLLGRPDRSGLLGDDDATGAHPTLELREFLVPPTGGRTGHEQDVGVTVEVESVEGMTFDHRDRHVHARVEFVPDLTDLVVGRATADQHQELRHLDRMQGRAAQVGTGLGEARLDPPHVDAEVRDLLDQRADLGRIDVLNAGRDDDRPRTELQERARIRVQRREGFGRHARAHAGSEQEGERARSVGMLPTEGPGGRVLDRMHLARPVPASNYEFAQQIGVERVVIELQRGHVEAQGQRPARHVVERVVVPRRARFEQRADQAMLGLIRAHDERGPGAEVEVGLRSNPLAETMNRDVMTAQELHHVPGAQRILVLAEDVGLDGMIGRFSQRVAIEAQLVVGQVVPHPIDRSQRGQRRDELIADREREVEASMFVLDLVAPRARLLEQDADGAVNVGIRGALAVVEVVEALFGVVERPDLVERFGMHGRDAPRQLDVLLGRERVAARRDAGLEEVRRT